MTKVNSFLTQRLKSATDKLSKMTNLVELSSQGNLSSFSGVFRVESLTSKEQEILQTLLQQFKKEEQEIQEDFKQLSDITAEVKAINNQAVMLHGERIKRAQIIFKNYRDGAFSAWLVATYGNRQTPYNFLQYYELYLALPHMLHQKLDLMPRQAVYSLASREGALELKQEIIQNYEGQSKQELLHLIRNTFPLAESDKRAQDLIDVTITGLKRLCKPLKGASLRASRKQKESLSQLLKEMKQIIDEWETLS